MSGAYDFCICLTIRICIVEMIMYLLIWTEGALNIWVCFTFNVWAKILSKQNQDMKS